MEKKSILVISLMMCQKCERISDSEGSWREFDESKDMRGGYLIDSCTECRNLDQKKEVRK